MSRRLAFAGLGLLAALVGCSEHPAPPLIRAGEGPDIVLIVADDLGYGDLGAYGNELVRTPNLDALAREGIRFSQGYVSAPMCAPSRAGLLTGRDHNRYGYDDPGTYLSEMKGLGDVRLPRREILLSEVLRAAGYETGAFGKWHLGARPGDRPLKRGFDRFFGHLSGTHDYFDWGPGLWGPIFRNEEAVNEGGYLTHATAREAVAFIEQQRAAPFFAYVAFSAIHPPFQVPQSYLDAYAHVADERQRLLAAMITALDEAIGSILEALQRLQRAEDTLVIFLSDNGGAFSSNRPLRGGKGTLLEGGIRVPFLMRWPGRLRAGGVFEPPVSAFDVLPTAAAAAGVRFAPDRPLDGVDLLPYLRGERHDPPHASLSWRWREQWAIRAGPLKLVHAGEEAGSVGSTGLYDLAADPGETRDLSAERPEAVARLRQQLRDWEAYLH
jgi:arylsulfatase A-like enzyme